MNARILKTALAAVAVLTLAPPPAQSDASPTVVASIAPVHSLVSGVMQGVGEPALLVRGGGSPHTYVMRPSDAHALEHADIVFWVGEDLETFLARPLEALAHGATVVRLSDSDGLTLLAFREGGPWEGHAHDEDHHADPHDHDDALHHADAHAHEDEHAHDNEGEHAHAHEDEHEDEHAHEHEDRHGHNGTHAHEDEHAHDHARVHGATDMHLWLDPMNAVAMVAPIVDALSAADPAHADAYRANGERLVARLTALDEALATDLAPVGDRPYIVFHDAYQYLENRYGLSPAGSITVSPEVRPGAERLYAIRERIRGDAAVCVFAEPQFEPRLLETVVEGTSARVSTLDPLGAALDPGPDLYFDLMAGLGNALRACLSGQT